MLCLGAKKPGGTAEEIEKYFGCPASSLVMVKIEFIICLFSQLLYFVSTYCLQNKIRTLLQMK